MRAIAMSGFDFRFIEREPSDRYAAASQIARSLPLAVPWLAPDITVALHQPAVREAIVAWLGRDQRQPLTLE